MTSIPYACSDAWLLLTILVAASADGATLDGIVSTGDAINHAVFTFHEIDGGLARLVAGGFVRVDNMRVFPTDEAKRIYDRVRRRKGSMLTQMDALRKKLGAPEWSTADDPNRADPAWSLAAFSVSELDRAYTNYQRQFSAALKRLEARGQRR